jgi:hypothetical protein
MILQQTEYTALPCIDLVELVMFQPDKYTPLERELAQRLWLATMDEEAPDGLDS